MIDRISLLGSVLWILGLATVLGSLSYVDWWRGRQTPPLPLRATLSRPALQAVLGAGMALFSGGLALAASRWWITVLWALPALLFAALSLAAWRAARRTPTEPAERDEPAPTDL